jgi:hypothetical protein
MYFCPLDPVDRNTAAMKQEVTRLQEMLNNLDFKRKVWEHYID